PGLSPDNTLPAQVSPRRALSHIVKNYASDGFEYAPYIDRGVMPGFTGLARGRETEAGFLSLGG
ncbi:MAG: hypothetical protein WCF53_04055, partial [Pseudolabrys sp.]